MLELRKISKKYSSENYEQIALDNVNLKFRKNEFVSILGPSGSGKTTLLNIIGGLDKANSGDLLINGNSTKKYKDRDWDSYRNNSIGFVFQNYNLISHQTVIENVEISLTLAGVSRKKRKERAEKVLEKVGLKEHINKKPNQLSGGQMQRVAIARALVNDPDILLADEPTGALDSETSIQIMELLAEIAKDRLVIMVTHNSALAEEYSTRIIELKDGKVMSDTRTYDGKEGKEKLEHKKTKMSFFTALSLSLKNLLTKKGRTFLTAFAGSIGIIGIALILSLSTGVTDYINRVQEDTLTGFPLTVRDKSNNFMDLMNPEESSYKVDEGNVGIDPYVAKMISPDLQKNDLKSFKKYVEENKEKHKDDLNEVQYAYNLNMQVYKDDEKMQQVVPSILEEKLNNRAWGVNIDVESSSMGFLGKSWEELLENKELREKQYEIVAGKYPENANEIILVTDVKNKIDDMAMFAMGLRDEKDLEKILPDKFIEKDKKKKESKEHEIYWHEKFLGLKFKAITRSDIYEKKGNIWVDQSENKKFIKDKLDKGIELEIVGIMRPKSETDEVFTKSYIGYTKELSEIMLKKQTESKIIKEQKANKDINIFTNTKFIENKDIDEFDINNLGQEDLMKFQSLSPEELAKYINMYNKNIDATYEGNLKKLGDVDLETPSKIYFYPKTFEAKDNIKKMIDEYNAKYENDKENEDKVIVYADEMGAIMSSVTNIINMITYILIAFVAISLVVSSIMISIITYISVLERTKEIGILRAVGASKRDISRVFIAETFIEGFLAGTFGIIITLLLNIGVNVIIENLTKVKNITSLEIKAAIILICVSILLTVFAGIIPSRIAAKKDPIEALRTE